MTSTCSSQLFKDPTYYLEDGDTTVKVSETLFKVHRSMLARDGSVFEEMFAADSPGTSSKEFDGRDDEHPIVLQGDTSTEFRSLLWSLYALPHEIAQATVGGDEDLFRLAYVAKVAHKYAFQTTEIWATVALFGCTSNFVDDHKEFSISQLEELTGIAILCGDLCTDLLLLMRKQWKVLIAEKKHLAQIMHCTHKLGLRDLEGCAYHAMMLEGRDVWDADPLLTREQYVRLLSGHYNLSKFGRNLQYNPPPLVQNAHCNNNVLCAHRWANMWELINTRAESGIGMQAMPHDKTDLLGRLMMAVSVMRSFDERRIPLLEQHDFATSSCRQAALQATVDMNSKYNAEVMDFFSDITTTTHIS